MANLVDIFTQTGGLKSETAVLNTSEDISKDKPSLFDSLLKTSIEDIENSSTENKNINSKIVSQNITSNLENGSLKSEALKLDTKSNSESSLDFDKINLSETSNSEELIEDLSKNTTDEQDKDDTKTDEPNKENRKTDEPKTDEIKKSSKNIQNSISSKNSLLDRLVLEVKNSNLEQINKSEQALDETFKSLENSDIKTTEKSFIKSLDDMVKELKKEDSVEEKIDTKVNTTIKDGTLLELVEQEIVTKDENSSKIENIDTKIIEVLTSNIDEELQNSIKIPQTIKEQSGENILEKKDIKSEVIKSEVIKNESVTKVEQKLSLMDQLIQANSQKDTATKIEEKVASNPQSIEQTNKNSKEMASNIFLADQKNSLSNQLLFNKNEAVNILKNASSIEDIEKSANILDLDANSLEVEQNITSENLEDLSIDEKEQQDRKNILNNILNEKNIRSVDVRNLITNSIEASKALLEDTIKIVDDKVLTLEPNFANSIQSRIVGAKQHLASMMSDVARQMYENYKPPVTAFRMNINPENMGTISILMKQDRASGLTINMSVSSLATLELLMENQNMLRNSLVKTFNDNSNFNLDFSKGEGGDKGQSSKDDGRKRDKNRDDTQSILKLKEENRDFEEKNDYM